MKEVPIKEILTNKIDSRIQYKVLDTDKVLGYINHRLYTDVESYAILELSKDSRHGVAVRVYIPAARCFDRKQAEEVNGIPNKICQEGKPFEIKFTYGKWRTDDGSVLGKVISEHCGYHYDVNF